MVNSINFIIKDTKILWGNIRISINFLISLLSLVRSGNDDLSNLINNFFSLTPDNKVLADRIKVNILNNIYTDKPTNALNIKGYELSRIANEFENTELIPNELKEVFPNLTTDDWDAFRRLITLIFLSLEIEN